MANKTKTSAKKVLGIAGIILAVVVAGGLFTTLFVKLDRQTTTTTIGGESYSIGLIGAEGTVTEGDTAIYLKKAITTDGLKCELAADAKIKYQIFFYDKDGTFISATEELTADFDGTGIPENATQAKIMITPTADEDGKVSLVEVLGYANQLTVTVKK